MLMLDLFSGLGGASRAMKERGWEVVMIDNDPARKPDILADIRDWQWSGTRPDLLWASPPCTDFSREDQPWTHRGIKPDLSCCLATMRLIASIKPRWWILENVRGAVPYLGRRYLRIGSRYLWGRFPLFLTNHCYGKTNIPSGKNQAALRALIPYGISLALAQAIEGVCEPTAPEERQ